MIMSASAEEAPPPLPGGLFKVDPALGYDPDHPGVKVPGETSEIAKARMAAWRARPRDRGYRDWLAAERLYVQGVTADDGTHYWPSAPKVAWMLGVPAQSIRQHCAKYKWVAKRRDFVALLKQKEAEHKAEALAASRVHDEFEIHSAAMQGVELVTRRLKQVKAADERVTRARQAYYKLRDEGADIAELEATGYDPFQADPIDARELQAISGALQSFHVVVQKATGGEAVRVEVTGAGGGPLEMRHSVRQELEADDVDRVARLFEVMGRVQWGAQREIESGNVIEGEVVE
jgi:hypothetical protein